MSTPDPHQLAEEVLEVEHKYLTAKTYFDGYGTRTVRDKVAREAAPILATALLEAEKENEQLKSGDGIAKRLRLVETRKQEIAADHAREEQWRLDLELKMFEAKRRIAKLVELIETTDATAAKMAEADSLAKL